MSRKKAGNKEDFKQEDVLQAIVIADNFNARFAPITDEKPSCLMSLVNIPILDYTLESLAVAGIQETFVFCCSHADQIKKHIDSKWMNGHSDMDVQVIVSENCMSAGDALRDIDAKSLIQNDFVLVSGDLVSNVKLGPLIEQHKARRLKDKTPVMTMLFKKVDPHHRTRCKEHDTVLVIKPENSKVLSFQRMANSCKLDLPVEVIEKKSRVQVRYDLLDCHISICSPHVLPLFTDEFDFSTRDHFIRGILVNEEIHGHTIHVHVIEEGYAASVNNLQMYDSVSQDIMDRLTYPLTPDSTLMSTPQNKCTYGRHAIYLQKDVTLARECVLKENVAIGRGTSIGNSSIITHSVIGNNCKIGENVILNHAYVLDNVTISDKCNISTSILDDNVTLLENVTVQPGCVLARNVVIGPGSVLNRATRLTSKPPEDDFDDKPVAPKCDLGSAYEYKDRGEDDDETDELAAELWGLHVESEDELQDDWDVSESESEEGVDEKLEAMEDQHMYTDIFLDEVIGTLERVLAENISTDNMVLEVNSLKHAYGIQIKEVNILVTRAILELPLKESSDLPPQQYLTKLQTNFKKFLPLLRVYIKSAESQMNCINSIEDLCVEKDAIMRVAMKLFHYLYEMELLAEDIIVAWHSKKAEDARRQKCRKVVEPFIQWLQEAEYESDSD